MKPIGLCLALVVILALNGCGKSTGQAAAQGKSTEPFRLDEQSVDVVIEEGDTADEYWLWLIAEVERGKLASISMNMQVNSANLAELKKVPQTAELLLDLGIVDDEALRLIVDALPNLEHFRARLSPITDVGAGYLSELKQLRLINIPQSQISAKGIASWESLEQLNHVRLGGNSIDDQALAALVRLPNLQSLHLIGPKLTDQGLQQLSQAKLLTSFYMDDCQLSERAWSDLKKARPDLHIHLDQNHLDRLQR